MGRRRGSLVTNDIELREGERLIVVTGANQGGKTTFSRTFGQLHWLAELGLAVPGESASLFAFDTIYTHYERQEDVMSLRGKLEDELVRVHDILERATSDSIVILNEIFSSTTLDDAVLLGTAVLRQLIERDVLAVCVTFVDELSTLSDTTVSLVAAVNPDEPTKRTLKLVRRPADGLAYALALADKYRLRGSQIVETIAEEQNR
jgi:DNA mismatch repair ATPase MutS